MIISKQLYNNIQVEKVGVRTTIICKKITINEGWIYGVFTFFMFTYPVANSEGVVDKMQIDSVFHFQFRGCFFLIFRNPEFDDFGYQIQWHGLIERKPDCSL